MRDLKTSEYDPLDFIIEEFTARVRGGEHPTVEEYVGRYPESADRIREFFPALAEIEHVGFTLGHVQESKKTVTRIGEYSILREIGRGGMGVVYEAVQESLGRHVAIKVLTASVNRNPQYLDRFRRGRGPPASYTTPTSSPFSAPARLTGFLISRCSTFRGPTSTKS